MSLYIAIMVPSIAWPIAIAGSVCSGITSAIWWTAQGVCFELFCEKIDTTFSASPIDTADETVEHWDNSTVVISSEESPFYLADPDMSMGGENS